MKALDKKTEKWISNTLAISLTSNKPFIDSGIDIWKEAQEELLKELEFIMNNSDSTWEMAIEKVREDLKV